jgi:hypothetical protein
MFIYIWAIFTRVWHAQIYIEFNKCISEQYIDSMTTFIYTVDYVYVYINKYIVGVYIFVYTLTMNGGERLMQAFRLNRETMPRPYTVYYKVRNVPKFLQNSSSYFNFVLLVC